jgi:hypothetical protein
MQGVGRRKGIGNLWLVLSSGRLTCWTVCLAWAGVIQCTVYRRAPPAAFPHSVYRPVSRGKPFDTFQELTLPYYPASDFLSFTEPHLLTIQLRPLKAKTVWAARNIIVADCYEHLSVLGRGLDEDQHLSGAASTVGAREHSTLEVVEQERSALEDAGNTK